MATTSEAEFLERVRVRLQEREVPAISHPGRLLYRTGGDRHALEIATPGSEAGALIEQFSRELGAVGGESIRAEGYAEAADLVMEKCSEMGWRKLIRDRDARLDRLGLDGRAADSADAGLHIQRERDDGASSGAGGCSIWDADVGLTWAEAGIAETGTIALFTAPDRSKRVSLVPFAHIAILPVAAIVATRGQLFRQMREDGAFPSSLTLVTGPSRTSDIENDKTIGVHGPRHEIAILVQDSAAGVS